MLLEINKNIRIENNVIYNKGVKVGEVIFNSTYSDLYNLRRVNRNLLHGHISRSVNEFLTSLGYTNIFSKDFEKDSRYKEVKNNKIGGKGMIKVNSVVSINDNFEILHNDNKIGFINFVSKKDKTYTIESETCKVGQGSQFPWKYVTLITDTLKSLGYTKMSKKTAKDKALISDDNVVVAITKLTELCANMYAEFLEFKENKLSYEEEILKSVEIVKTISSLAPHQASAVISMLQQNEVAA